MTRPGRTAVLVLITAVVVLSGCHRDPAPIPPIAPAPVVSASFAPAGSDHTHVDPDHHDGVLGAAPAPADPAARRAAEQFVTAWARPRLPAPAWLAGVRPHATPGYAALLETVDPANVPAHTVLGPAQVVLSTQHRADFDVPTDAGPMRVTCVLHGEQWLIATIEAQQ